MLENLHATKRMGYRSRELLLSRRSRGVCGADARALAEQADALTRDDVRSHRHALHARSSKRSHRREARRCWWRRVLAGLRDAIPPIPGKRWLQPEHRNLSSISSSAVRTRRCTRERRARDSPAGRTAAAGRQARPRHGRLTRDRARECSSPGTARRTADPGGAWCRCPRGRERFSAGMRPSLARIRRAAMKRLASERRKNLTSWPVSWQQLPFSSRSASSARTHLPHSAARSRSTCSEPSWRFTPAYLRCVPVRDRSSPSAVVGPHRRCRASTHTRPRRRPSRA